MQFYERTLGGKIQMMMPFSEAPPEMRPPGGGGDRMMHVSLKVGDRVLMASDTGPGMTYEGMKGFSVSLSYPSASEGQRVFDALAAGGQVGMPFQKTFWAAGFGMLTDKFGTPWMVNAEQG
jgi:PhnB protein